MKLGSFRIDWKIENGQRVSGDPELLKLAQAFADAELKEPLDVSQISYCWVICRLDSDGKPVEVLSIGAIQMVPDCPLFRTKQGKHASKATKLLWERLNFHLADLGLRGQDAFVHIDEAEADEGRCPSWRSWLKLAGAKSSNRVAITIR